MGVLSKQIERYEEIEAQNLNLKADIQDEKECLLDLQNKIGDIHILKKKVN